MFTIAHLSDPHLSPLPEPTWVDLLGKRVTGYINWQRKRRFIHETAVLDAITDDMKRQAPDHIAVTGDIVNIGLEEEFRHGREWLATLGSTRDVSFVPGNHDMYVTAAGPFAQSELGAYMVDDKRTGGFPYLRRRGKIALIGVSSGVPTAPFMASGWVGTQQLAALAALLEKLKDEDLFRVIMIHHPPVSPSPKHKQLLDARVLIKILREHGANLVLTGHDHMHMMSWLTGPEGTRIPAIGVPSASARPGNDKDAAGYHLYAIDRVNGAWRCELTARSMKPDGTIVEIKRMMLTEEDGD